MKRRILLSAACLAGLAATASAQEMGWPSGYGGFGGQYIQAPSLYYPFPGAIESRFGDYFSVPVVPTSDVESPVEAASIDATNAAHEGIDPAAKARADADALAEADGAGQVANKAARNNRRAPRETLRNRYAPPPPYRRALPRGNYEALNDMPAGVPTYSPYARHQTYGNAYGMGPYGSNFYSGWWKGYTPMDIYTGGEIYP
ncbi:hypothetical protein [Paludisphaera sp.]|uniref:hypothetical protein n=1 Tax=Paludisphaera sp. TaxID=2017432 RepID=UPI00301BD5B2